MELHHCTSPQSKTCSIRSRMPHAHATSALSSMRYLLLLLLALPTALLPSAYASQPCTLNRYVVDSAENRSPQQMTTCLTMDDNCDVLYTDITEAIYAAASSSSPAEVHLCPGLYKINKTIHIDTFNTTSFSIIGVQGANLTRLVGGPQLLRIDGDSQKLMMKCSISGITFVNGTAAAASDSSVEEGGGCLVLSGNLSVSVSSCWFNSCTAYVTNNTGGGGGGAVLMRNIPEADFTNCHFKANRVNIKNYRIVIAYYPNVVARIGGSAVHVTLSGGADDKKDHTFTSCTFVDNIALVTDPRIGKSSLFDPHVSQCKVGIGVSFTDTIFLAGGAVTIASTGVFHFHDTNFRNNSMLVGKPSMRMRMPMDLAILEIESDFVELGSSECFVKVENSTISHISLVQGRLLLIDTKQPSTLSVQHAPSESPGSAATATAPNTATVLQSLYLLSQYARVESVSDIAVNGQFVWLGGKLSIPTGVRLEGCGYIISVPPNANILQASSLLVANINISSPGMVFIDGIFVSGNTLLIENHGKRLVFSSNFQAVGMDEVDIENYGVIIWDKRELAILGSYVQYPSGKLLFTLPEISSGCITRARPFSGLHTLKLNGTLGLTLIDGNENNCKLLQCFNKKFSSMPFEMQIEFLRSREPPDISLQSIGVEGVVMTFSYKRNASAYVPYTLVGNIKKIGCSVFSQCDGEMCVNNTQCSWYTNYSSTTGCKVCSLQCGTCDRADVATVRGQKRKLYSVVDGSQSRLYLHRGNKSCCPYDCNRQHNLCSETGCNCIWYSSDASFCKSWSSTFWLAVAFGVGGGICLVIIFLASIKYSWHRQHALADLSKWQAETCHQWIMDAEEKAQERQGIPPAFLIELDSLNILEEIGAGGFGRVYRGHLAGTTEVAIKRFQDFVVHSVSEMERFKQEACLMCSLHHPNIVQLMGIAFEGGNILIVMEFMVNGSVKDLLSDPQFKVDWKFRISAALDTANGLAYLHGKDPPVIHRDLKTQNLLVSGKYTVKLADFGYTKLIYRSMLEKDRRVRNSSNLQGTKLTDLDSSVVVGSPCSFTASGCSFLERKEVTDHLLGSSHGARRNTLKQSLLKKTMMNTFTSAKRASTESSVQRASSGLDYHTAGVGTPNWCAPELFKPGSDYSMYGPSCDVYAFGLILWSLVTGLQPFPEFEFYHQLLAAVVSGKRPDIPKECPSAYRRLMEDSWSGNPAKRPKMATAIRALEDMNKFYQ